MIKFNSYLERNLTIVVGVLTGVIVIMVVVWGATANINNEEEDLEDKTLVTCPLTQIFAVNNIPILPGNYRDIKIYYPTSFQNIPQHVAINIVSQALTVSPPTSLTITLNGNDLSEAIGHRNDYLNFVPSKLAGDTHCKFIGASTSPKNLAQNTGNWVAIKCTEKSMQVALGSAVIDQIEWDSPITYPTNTKFKSASGPVLAVGYNIFAWFGINKHGDRQLEIIDSTTPTLKRIDLDEPYNEEAINILGFQDQSSGSRIVVVWPSKAVSYHFNVTSKKWDVNMFWEKSGTKVCHAGAFTHDSSLYDVVLMITDNKDITSYVNFTHTIVTQDNSWIKNPNTITAPITTPTQGNLFVNKAANNGDFFVYTSSNNNIYITRIPQTWNLSDILNFTTTISSDVDEVALIVKADLFGINESPCITYRSSSKNVKNVNTVGLMSFHDTSSNQKIKVMSNSRRNFATAKMDLTVSSVQGIDSLILYTPVENDNCSKYCSQSFPLLATVNANVLAIQ